MSEVWKTISGYEGLYEVSDSGNVRSLDRLIKSKNNGTMVKKGRIVNKYLVVYKGLVE